MAQKRTSRKKKQRVLKKKGEKTVGGLPFNRTQDEEDKIRNARTPQDGTYALEKFNEGMTANKEIMKENIKNMETGLNTVPNAIGNSKFVQEGKKWYNTKQEEYKKASEDLVERARNPIRSSQEEMKEMAAYNAKNPPPKTTNVLNTVKNAFDTPLFKKKEEKKKKGKIGNFEKKFAKVGEKLDKIAFDLDFDSSKSSDKAPIIKQTLIESISNKSNILNDAVQEKMNTETGYKNANPMDVIWAETVRQIEDMFAKYQKAASGKMEKDQGTKTTTVIETEVFPAQKEKIHTPLLKFLYDMILVPENDEEFKKIVWSFIAKINEKALIDKNVPSGFKEIQEITYTTNSAMAGYTDTNDGEEIGPANGGSTRKGRRKKQRGGTLQLNGLTVQFDVIEKETLFYSVLSNGAEISTTNNFLKDLQEMDKTKTYPFSLLFFDLETIEEDWLQKPESVDILLGLLKEKEKGILVADPELEFKGTQEKLVLRATFRLENGVYGIFVHNSVQELDTVLNLLDGMELVEVNEKEEVEVEKKVKEEVEKKEVKGEVEKKEVKEVPIGATAIGEENNKREEEKQPEKSNWELEKEAAITEGEEFDKNVKEANEKRLKEEEVKSTEEEERNKPKRISDAILKTAIRLVADSLKGKAPSTEKAETSELVPISKETITTLTQYDPTVVPIIENIRKGGDVINNYVQTNTTIFNIIEDDKSEKEPSDELKKDIVELKTQNEQIYKDLVALTALFNNFITDMNSQITTTITDQSQISTAVAVKINTNESGTQTQSLSGDDDENKKRIEKFKAESQEQITALETKVETLRNALQEKDLQSKLKDEKYNDLFTKSTNLSSQLQELKQEKEHLEQKQVTTTSSNTQTENNTQTLPEVKPLALTAKNLQNQENQPRNQNQTAGEVSNTHFDISEKGLTVGTNKKNHLHLDWDYIKYIKNEKAKDHHFIGEADTFNALIRPQIIDERIHWNQQLLNMLDKLLDLKKLNSKSKNEAFNKHRQLVTNVLNLSGSKPEEIPTTYHEYIVNNILYAVYTYTPPPVDTIKPKPNYSNIQTFFLHIRKNLNDYFAEITANPKYFDNPKNVADYLKKINDFHEIITKKGGYNDRINTLYQNNQEKIKKIQAKTVHTETGTTDAPVIHITPEDENLYNPIRNKRKKSEPELVPINKLYQIYSERRSEDINEKIKKELGKISNEPVFKKSSENSNHVIDNTSVPVVKLQLMHNKHLNKNVSDTKSDKSSKATTNHDIEYTTIENYTLNNIETEVNNTKTKIVNILETIEEYTPSERNTPINSNLSSARTTSSSGFETASEGSVSSPPGSSRSVNTEPRLDTKRKVPDTRPKSSNNNTRKIGKKVTNK